MTRPSLVALCMLFLLPDAHAQAVRLAPSTGPLIVQQPPSYPGNPVHTPAGAGASHGSIPGVQKATLPPSPNKRLLPPTKEAGLWAADGARAAIDSHTHPLFNIRLPYPSFAKDEESAIPMTTCVASMAVAADNAGRTNEIKELPAEVRKCMASRAVGICLDGWMALLQEGAKNGVVWPEKLLNNILSTATHVAVLNLKNCKEAKDVGWGQDYDDVLKELARAFADGVRENLKAGLLPH